MIEVTAEMKAAFRAAQERRANELVAEGAPLGGHDILDRGLAAALAIVERDYCKSITAQNPAYGAPTGSAHGEPDFRDE